MKILSKFLFALLSTFVFSGFFVSTALAFPSLDLKLYPNEEKTYNALVQSYSERYKKIPTFTASESKRIAALEDRIGVLLLRSAEASSISQKRRYAASFRLLSRQLNAQVLKLEKKYKVSAISTPIPSLSLPSLAQNTTWSGATSADILYYADMFEGRNTSNGNTFLHEGFSAARCDIPLNTLLQVRYGDSAVLVKANDRPNCTKHPDIVDLTKTAFETLAPLSKGRLAGSFLPLGTIKNNTTKIPLDQNFFRDL